MCRDCDNFGDVEECKICYDNFAIRKMKGDKMRIPFFEAETVQGILKSDMTNDEMSMEIWKIVRQAYDKIPGGITLENIKRSVDEFFMEVGR